MSLSSGVLLIVGSGPGIGLSTATLFAAREFMYVALIARNQERLQEDRVKLLTSIENSNRTALVKTWGVDISDTKAYEEVLQDVQKFGRVTCVIFNAARVGPSQLLEFGEKEILADFMTSTIALYTTAKWAIPILIEHPENAKPSFFVTSSLLWDHPVPQLFSLSMTKAAQRNLVMSLKQTYPSIHVALLNIGGPVSDDDKFLNPGVIAEKFWELYERDVGKQTLELYIPSGSE